ncbi:hypothetical protein [Desulforamulus aeronauticus]|uniref:Uncharacterized protein n=1 Tax=Desulforamulus aeronauticus DSM 10349 TaxID=1121421 RepID=A0A1M6XIM4_9FIRM|nr:hypothetical protein [Desulforamulus aeronauticus]SHL05766.1 hypothetical protein SAMN02745123_04036 [Desulforamulus aeronauticus DSM 10349]
MSQSAVCFLVSLGRVENSTEIKCWVANEAKKFGVLQKCQLEENQILIYSVGTSQDLAQFLIELLDGLSKKYGDVKLKVRYCGSKENYKSNPFFD